MDFCFIISKTFPTYINLINTINIQEIRRIILKVFAKIEYPLNFLFFIFGYFYL